ncbi:MAG: glycoside hydrolase, partial [Desulfuromonadaceae bacterium]
YSIKDLFRDEQRHILNLIISGTLQEFEDKFITLYENSKSLMGFLRETGMPVPHRFMTTAETALNLKLQKMFASETVDLGSLGEDIDEINNWNIDVDTVTLEFIIRRRLEGAMTALREEPESSQLVDEVLHLVESIAALPVEVNLWQTQNIYWDMLQSRTADIHSDTGGPASGNTWSEAVRNLGQLLFFNTPAMLATAKENK